MVLYYQLVHKGILRREGDKKLVCNLSKRDCPHLSTVLGIKVVPYVFVPSKVVTWFPHTCPVFVDLEPLRRLRIRSCRRGPFSSSSGRAENEGPGPPRCKMISVRETTWKSGRWSRLARLPFIVPRGVLALGRFVFFLLHTDGTSLLPCWNRHWVRQVSEKVSKQVSCVWKLTSDKIQCEGTRLKVFDRPREIRF